MDKDELKTTIQHLFAEIEKLAPVYASNPLDAFAEGNIAICIIDKEGNLYGHIWGTDKIKGRNFFNNAWKKASQVWITNMPTGEYEKRLYSGEFDEELYGISKPDLIGWEGGQPITLPSGEVLSVGFSGFRGFNDIDIVQKAFNNII